MTKSEVNELKKLLKLDDTAVDMIAYAYIDHNKEILAKDKARLGVMPEEDGHKWLDLFGKTHAGKIGKNLIETPFTTADETGDDTFFKILFKLRESTLSDDSALDDLYKHISDHMDYAENFLVAVMHNAYDVPVKGKDKTKIGESEEIFDYICIAICPVKTEKAGLCFNKDKIESKEQRFVVDAPINGLIFPAFTDRSTDLHAMMFFVKKPEDMHKELLSSMAGTTPPLSATEQQKAFDDIIDGVVGESADFEVIKSIHESVAKIVSDGKGDSKPPAIDKDKLRDIFMDAGVSDMLMEKFDKAYDGTDAGEGLLAVNVLDSDKFDVKTPDVQIKVKGDKAHLIEEKMVEGKKCIVIAAESVTVNGVSVK